MNFLGIKETCIYSENLEEARNFYHDLLGLSIISYEPDKHIFFRAGASVLLCFNPEASSKKESPPAHYGKGKLHFAFEVASEEYHRVKSEIKKLGIPITDEVTWANGIESFYFEDPAGNVLEILPESGIWD